MKPYYSIEDFLSDELFIYWRLYPSKELDRFWDEFITKNDHLKTPFEKAIEEFESINNLPAVGVHRTEQVSGVYPVTEDKITWESGFMQEVLRKESSFS